MLRFSLVGLLAAVLIVALGCAALVNASEVWVHVVITATIVALLASAAGAFYLPETARVFAGGFAIFGWSYLLLAQGPLLDKNTQAVLLTKRITQAVFDRVSPPQVSPPGMGGGAGMAAGGGGMRGAGAMMPGGGMPGGAGGMPRGGGAPGGGGMGGMNPLYAAAADAALFRYYFQQIAEWLWVVVIACAGGVAARLFDGRRRKTKAA